MSRSTILHISFDYPDANRRPKTKAIRNLVRSTKEFNHLVISLNRVSNPFQTSVIKTDGMYTFNVFFFRYGIFLNFFLVRIARKISRYLADEHFDIIHSHKLTFEGIIGNYLANTFNKKHIITIRGNTDIKVLLFKIFSRQRYRKLLDAADQLITVSPWTATEIKRIFKKDYSFCIIPNISFIERFQTHYSSPRISNNFITTFVFERNNHKIKNIARVFAAFKAIVKEHPQVRLTIIGDGSQKNYITQLISRFNLDGYIDLPGFKRHDEMAEYFRNSIAFVMPSFPETFGLVYLESLSAGLPIIHSKKAGVDGFFPSHIAYRVDHSSVKEIKMAMLDALVNQMENKKQILRYLDSGAFTIFATSNIVNDYQRILCKALDLNIERNDVEMALIG
jgi:glycosyltransferase involved in cell wall biosynthesis